MHKNVTEIIKRVKRIEITARKHSEESMSGDYLSAFKGDGANFAELREYAPGDDIRRLDAFASAKRNKPYVKEYQAEREFNVIFAVDCGAKMFFGSGDYLKIEKAAEIFANIAFSAASAGDKVGVILFDEKIFKVFTPGKGYKKILAAVESILAHDALIAETNYNEIFRFINKTMRKNSIVFFMSDFIKPVFNTELKICAQKFDLSAVKIYDEYDYKPSTLGLIDILGAGGTNDIVDGSDLKTQNSLSKLQLADDKILHEAAVKYGFKVLNIESKENYYLSLRNYFKNRIKRGLHGMPKREKRG